MGKTTSNTFTIGCMRLTQHPLTLSPSHPLTLSPSHPLTPLTPPQSELRRKVDCVVKEINDLQEQSKRIERAMLLAIAEKERVFEISRKFDVVHKDIINSPILERIADENDLKHLMANSKASPAPHHRTTGGVLSPLNPANLSNLMSR